MKSNEMEIIKKALEKLVTMSEVKPKLLQYVLSEFYPSLLYTRLLAREPSTRRPTKIVDSLKNIWKATNCFN